MTSFRLLAAALAAGLVVSAAAACDSSDDSGARSAEPDASPEASPAKADGGGSDSSTDDPEDAADAGPVPSVEAADVCPEAAKKICTFLSTCSPEAVGAAWASPSECEPRFRDNCLASYPSGAKVRKDDADAYTACLGNLACDDRYGPRWTVACATPRLATTKALGQPCRSDFECDSRTCTGSSTTCGTCVTRKKAGDACTSSRECPEGGFCSNDKCLAVAFLGDACDANRMCGNGLGCESGKCVKIGAVGTSCDSDLDCDIADLVDCNRGTGKCEKVTFVDPGSTCPAAFAPEAPKACSKGSSCIRPAFDAGTCVTNAKVGEACSASVRCEAFINCRDGECVLPTYKPCP